MVDEIGGCTPCRDWSSRESAGGSMETAARLLVAVARPL